MKKLIVIKNGKKYIVNIPSLDEDNVWLDGVWMESIENISLVNFRITEDENIRITEDGLNRILEI